MMRPDGDRSSGICPRFPHSLASSLAVITIAAFATRAAGVEMPPNAAPGVQYIGAEKCAACHKKQHDSFLQTSHSRAAQRTDVAKEPGPGEFTHEASGNHYEVNVVDGKLVHREQLLSNDGNVLDVTAKAMDVTLGSGTHAKTYLFRSGPFHIESPITWYAADQRWGLSPGYDKPAHPSFRRNVANGCVFCHVGRITRPNDNPYKFTIAEHEIGCERCHGPGQLHQQRHQKHPGWTGPDDTIVNPRSLPRELSEAICQQCHCQGIQAVNPSGKQAWDYRPGLRLTDYRVDFQFWRSDESMRLVGHVEQLHQSACYMGTESLTCVSCHDPHDPPPASNPVAYYRDKCYECHADRECGKPHADRMSANQNDCSECHMPPADTNVSHVALHDHRIRVQSNEVDRSFDDATEAKPILDISHLPAAERRRLMALAKYEIYRNHGSLPQFADYDNRAIAALIQIKQAGEATADVDAALAWLAISQGQTAIAERMSREVLRRNEQEAMSTIVATDVLARILFSRNDFQQTLPLYRRLNDYHRNSRDRYFLGLVEQNTRNTDAAIKALRQSIEIDPAQVSAHAALHAILLSNGQVEEAEKHREAAAANQLLQQRYQRPKEGARNQ